LRRGRVHGQGGRRRPAHLRVAGVAGYCSDAAAFGGSSPRAYKGAIVRELAAQRRWEKTGAGETIPTVAPDGGDVAMPLREAYEY
jgi:hypothetical protein